MDGVAENKCLNIASGNRNWPFAASAKSMTLIFDLYFFIKGIKGVLR
jgi:hypothetical protein